MYQHSFEKLNVWQDSIDLVELIYNTVKTFPNDEKFGLVSQMKRCSVSISSNLAEGTSRITKKDKAHFLRLLLVLKWNYFARLKYVNA